MPDFSYSETWIAKGVLQSQWTIGASGVPTGIGQTLIGAGLADKTVEIDFGGATGTSSITIEGRNGATAAFTTLQDDQNTDLTFTNNGVEVIMQNPREIRPRGGTVTGTAGVIVTIISREKK